MCLRLVICVLSVLGSWALAAPAIAATSTTDSQVFDHTNTLVTGCPRFDYAVDDPAHGVLSPGQSITCTFQLHADPGVRTRVDLFSNQERLTLSPSSFVLTEADWSWPRTITVTAVEDEWLDPRRSLVGIDAWIRTQAYNDYPYHDYDAFDKFSTQLRTISLKQQDTPGLTGRAGQHMFPPFIDYLPDGKAFYVMTNKVRIGAVEISEPEPYHAFLIHPASQLTDVEGRLPGAIWVRPAKRPRDREVSVTLMQYGSGSLVSRENWVRFKPDNWQQYQPLYYGRREDMQRQRPASGVLRLGMSMPEYPNGDMDTHRFLTWPYPSGYGQLEYPRWMRSSQPIKVRVLDNDRRTRAGWFVIGSGQRAPDLEPKGRVQISFGCSRQEFISREAVASGRLIGARAWRPAPTATHKGLPEIGFRGHLWAKTPRGIWRKIGTNKLVHAYQMIVPNYQWQDVVVVIPRWTRALRVTCDTPRGLPTFNEPVSLHLNPPHD